MPSVIYVPSRVGEGHFTDFQSPAVGATDNGKFWAWNSATSKFEPVTIATVTPGGSSTHVQRNNGGVFAGDSGFTYDGAGKATLSAALVVPAIRPASNSTTALQLQNAAGTAIVTVDTTNSRVGIGTTPSYPLHIVASLATNSARALQVEATINNSSVGTQYAARSELTINTSNSGGTCIAHSYSATVTSNTKPTSVVALSTATNHIASSGTLSEQIEWQTGPAVIGAVVTSNLYHAQIRNVFTASGATVGAQYGIYVQSLTSGTTANYSIYTNAGDIRLMSSNSDKIGFHGVTPVARQLLATGAGRTVDDVITFLQNLGLARQS